MSPSKSAIFIIKEGELTDRNILSDCYKNQKKSTVGSKNQKNEN